jgi:hypothetical protein
MKHSILYLGLVLPSGGWQSLISVETSKQGSWPYPSTLDQDGEASRDKHTSLLQAFVNYK